MGYDALGVGPYDLAAGIDFIRVLGRDNKIKWISANLITTAGKRVFPAYTIINRDGVRLAVIGLTGSSSDLGPILKHKYRIISWKKSLPGVIAGIKKKNPDFIVLLSSVVRNNYQEISRAFPDIRMIIDATTSRTGNMSPKLISNLLVGVISARGKYLARLDINGTLAGPWIENLDNKRQNLLRRIDSINWRLDRLRKRKTVPQPQYLAALEKQKKAATDSLEKIAAREKNTAAGMKWQGRFLAIEPEVKDAPEVLGLITAGKKKVLALKKELNIKTQTAAQARRKIFALGYTGLPTCRRCHEAQAKKWLASRHSRAWNTLREKNETANPKCLKCHVSTTREAAEPYLLYIPSSLRQVGCEACHGPGQNHAADPNGAEPGNPSPASACAGCHTSEHDDDFNLRRDLEIICGPDTEPGQSFRLRGTR